MPPVEVNAHARNNLFAYAPFGGHIALVVGLTAHVLLVARRAAKSLPPTTSTRFQQPLRRNYVIFFSLLAALSLATVTTFAILWRADSYEAWVNTGASNSTLASFTGGWYATGDEGRWYLGDWIRDIDLQKESDKMTVATPEGFLYTTQHFIALMASSIFFGVEGHRRNLQSSTIASFVVLGATGSLGYALSLFFVTMLYTPLTVHEEGTPLHDTLFAPSPVVYYVPIILSVLYLSWLPDLLVWNNPTLNLLRQGNLIIPLLLAFAPKIVPVSLGHQHVSKAAAHRSYAKVFRFLSIAAVLFYWRRLYANVSANTPEKYSSGWRAINVVKNKVGITNEEPRNRVLSGISTAAQSLQHISKNPIVSVTSSDVLFTTIALLAWTFIRNLDVEAVLESSFLSFLVPKHEKHVAFEDDAKRLADLHSEPEPEHVVETTTPKKRGRPAKNKASVNGDTTSAVGSLRRSTRRGTRSVDLDSDTESITTARALHVDYESDGEAAYQPSSTTKRAVAETEADGATAEPDFVHGGESTALALFLTFAGGLGELAAGALGAEIAGPQE